MESSLDYEFAFFEASGFVPVNDAFFGGFVDVALGAGVALRSGALDEVLQRGAQAALGFAVANSCFVCNFHTLFC